ncbi:DUF6366 family protein [Pontibacillus marinus]|uniref:Phage capsid protein n=1 Tax=Pontibacillus marinus BH030004 = DSM 16465 TaxID=1385511 RepID=A0A0A5FYK0_9BACI|nr:DUF6366 family protein [Pontibacillus marinus]KGX84874.1 phage capsid protein [Pontibacillus marinus BH030004 = DSM 16465]
MQKNNGKPGEERERIRQEEVKRNPGGNLNDAFNRGEHTNLVDLVGGLGWRKTGLLIVVFSIVFIILFFIL